MARILVVEDDDRVRALLTRQLGVLGHEVYAVADVAAALDSAWAADLAIVHIGVPGGGWTRLPVPIVATSGGPRDAPVPPEATALLRKPYTLAELAEVIERVLVR
ncbi:response regulator [Phytohabitans rumicis]|uniref:Response regulatory domain-containing protein n=1 Tax=Phytohabitans rumicis TaxID=1076125 RepID=A0A6V8LFP9_9ACTN|nr:response regulator [Phytohabitans rumicis]GFJ95134.1 hypothetical protein Prum_087760 [Phytohabitans rumicis]